MEHKTLFRFSSTLIVTLHAANSIPLSGAALFTMPLLTSQISRYLHRTKEEERGPWDAGESHDRWFLAFYISFRASCTLSLSPSFSLSFSLFLSLSPTPSRPFFFHPLSRDVTFSSSLAHRGRALSFSSFSLSFPLSLSLSLSSFSILPSRPTLPRRRVASGLTASRIRWK